ncbi:MAG: FAD-binding protein [Candidatus Rokuibacteriota bacterium]
MADVLDVLIVGGGAAGYTAGIFAARDRGRALLLEKFSAGGQVLNCEHITNFPGFPQGVAGYTRGISHWASCDSSFFPSPPEGERVRVRGRAGRGTRIREELGPI